MTYSNRHGILRPVSSVICLLLMFAALDDIGNINETDVSLEYVALGCCLAWFVVVAIGLLRRGHQVLGAVTLSGVAIMTWAVLYGARLQPSTAERLTGRAAFVVLVIVTLTLFTLKDTPGENGSRTGDAVI
jgi:hypothetical protein